MFPDLSLDDRIGCLTADVDALLKTNLEQALRSLRDADDLVGTMVNLSRSIEGPGGFLDLIAKTASFTPSRKAYRSGINVQINELRDQGVIETSIAENLHWIRKRRNDGAHTAQLGLSAQVVEDAIDRMLTVAEWFYCSSEYGPKLDRIYESDNRMVTLQSRFAKFSSHSAQHLQLIITTLTLDRAGNGSVRVGADPANLKKVARHLVEILQDGAIQDVEVALYVNYWISIYEDFEGRRKEARQVLDDVLEDVLSRVPTNSSTPTVEWQIRVLDRAAHLATKQADCQQAERFADRILELSNDIAPNLIAASALQRLGRSQYFQCNYDVAREFLEESLIQFQSLNPKDLAAVSWLQFDLGMLEADIENFDEAKTWLEKSLPGQENYGDRNGCGTVRVNLGYVLHRLGESRLAHRQMETAKHLLQDENYFRWYLHFLGRIHADDGAYDLARINFRQSLQIFERREDWLGITRSLIAFSWLAAKQGNWGKAVCLLAAESQLRGRLKLPFPADWANEKQFIETGIADDLAKSGFKMYEQQGWQMSWKTAVKYALGP